MSLNEHPGYVYFVHAVAVGRVKIGWTKKHPDARLAQLQVSSPVQLEPIGVMEGDQGLESEMHAAYGAWRCIGEWFDADEGVLRHIRQHADPWPDRAGVRGCPEDATEFRLKGRLAASRRHEDDSWCDKCSEPLGTEACLLYESTQAAGQRIICLDCAATPRGVRRFILLR